uniref:Uncharacterized protein n=1 Tax=Octopus bimaculoides TaxID=37653 RepID=A0A0L8HVZ9_OCTBM
MEREKEEKKRTFGRKQHKSGLPSSNGYILLNPFSKELMVAYRNWY